MAERRMFTKKVTDDDAFMSLSSSAQALYLHLNMAADDDGFCNQVAISMFRAHASVQDLEALLEKRYVYQFENGVIVIKHWRMANALRKDRYTTTNFQHELKQLHLNDKDEYEITSDGCQLVTDRLPDGCQEVASCLPQDRIGKDRIGKDNIECITNVIHCPSGDGRFSEIVQEWNGLSAYGIAQVKKIVDGSIRAKQLKARISQYGEDAIIEAIDRIRRSSFLQGNNSRGWIITFDWFIKPSNFAKVYEGNYDNSTHKRQDEPTGADAYFAIAMEGRKE